MTDHPCASKFDRHAGNSEKLQVRAPLMPRQVFLMTLLPQACHRGSGGDATLEYFEEFTRSAPWAGLAVVLSCCLHAVDIPPLPRALVPARARPHCCQGRREGDRGSFRIATPWFRRPAARGACEPLLPLLGRVG